MLVGIIIACEIGFWVVLLAGLAARYLLRRPRLGATLLVCVPLVDLVLLGATVLDLRRGAVADWTHGLAAVYLGFSVAFGHGIIRRADERFAHRFAGGPAPAPKLPHGRERARVEWREFAKGLLAGGIACALLLTAVIVVAEPSRTAALTAWAAQVVVILLVWAAYAGGYALWARRAPVRTAAATSRADGR